MLLPLLLLLLANRQLTLLPITWELLLPLTSLLLVLLLLLLPLLLLLLLAIASKNGNAADEAAAAIGPTVPVVVGDIAGLGTVMALTLAPAAVAPSPITAAPLKQ